MRILLILIFGITVFGCDNRPIIVKDLVQNSKIYEMKWAKIELGSFVDSAYTDSIDINTVLDFKTINLNGTVKSVEMETALRIYNSNIEKDSSDVYPIFEIKNSSKVILPVFGQGLWDKIWAKVLLDKETMKVINIEFDHKSETPGVGGNINNSIFKEQFIGSTIILTKNNYTLYQNDKKLIEGKHRIDGMSGATITSKGAVEMLNDDLLRYYSYLR